MSSGVVLNFHMIGAHLTPSAQIRAHGPNLTTTSTHVNTSLCINVHLIAHRCASSWMISLLEACHKGTILLLRPTATMNER
jgi:hypothetical protein